MLCRIVDREISMPRPGVRGVGVGTFKANCGTPESRRLFEKAEGFAADVPYTFTRQGKRQRVGAMLEACRQALAAARGR